jgi:glycosyltransferase involved in cell wall biosynthesis
VINSIAATELSLRKGVSSVVIPNVMDFDSPPPAPDGFAADLRSALGIGKDERFFLQPTRVVARRGIEQAIELVRRLDLPAVAVVSHASGDEGEVCETYLRE